MKKSKAPSPYLKKALKVVARAFLIVFLFSLAMGGAYALYTYRYRDAFYPGVKIENISFAGLSFLEALERVEEPLSHARENGLKFSYQNVSTAIPQEAASSGDLDISIPFWDVRDAHEMVNEAYRVGREGNGKKRIQDQVNALFRGKRISLGIWMNDVEMKKALQANFSEFDTPAQNAKLTFRHDEPKILSEKMGKILDYDTAIHQALANLASLKNQNIVLALIDDEPQIKEKDVVPLLQEAKNLLAKAPYTLRVEEKIFEVSKEEFASWLTFKKHQLGTGEGLEKYLKDINEEIRVEPREGKFSIDSDRKIEQIQESQAGKEIDMKTTISNIEQAFLSEGKKEKNVSLSIVEPQFRPDNLSDEIQSLLGTGQTNFTGSSTDRIKNITRGAEILNGILIPPDQEFSLVEALGEIDAEHGWFPGYVIKGDATVLEYGGGLCQIGSTFFRAAMGSGMPITERQNHSYAVSYYNYEGKPGVDATIYGPHPDFRFMNDTGYYMLLETRTEGTNLYFDLWGTSDGRKGSFTAPRNSNWITPPPTRYIETDTLPAGQEKCSEIAHTGVTAEFDYTVENANGEKETRTFKSVYKPWQAVCLRGKVS